MSEKYLPVVVGVAVVGDHVLRLLFSDGTVGDVDVYEIVLQEGRPADILAYVDGALLIDLWDDLVLPRPVRSAWAPVIQLSRGMAA